MPKVIPKIPKTVKKRPNESVMLTFTALSVSSSKALKVLEQ